MAEKILLIDDDHDFVEAIRVILEQAGYLCEEAASAREGMEQVDAYQPDLIILDEMLEDISAGFRFSHALRKREAEEGLRHIPILMVSSVQKLTELPFKERVGTELMPVEAFLDKPVEPEVLVTHVREILGNEGR